MLKPRQHITRHGLGHVLMFVLQDALQQVVQGEGLERKPQLPTCAIAAQYIYTILGQQRYRNETSS